LLWLRSFESGGREIDFSIRIMANFVYKRRAGVVVIVEFEKEVVT
jgi:hypothetical protein